MNAAEVLFIHGDDLTAMMRDEKQTEMSKDDWSRRDGRVNALMNSQSWA